MNIMLWLVVGIMFFLSWLAGRLFGFHEGLACILSLGITCIGAYYAASTKKLPIAIAVAIVYIISSNYSM